MQVTFTKHAIQRFNQRLNVSLNVNSSVNISSMFTLANTYTNTSTNRKMLAFCFNNHAQKAVLIVDALTRQVVTVYLDSLNDVYGSNVISATYAKLKQRQH